METRNQDKWVDDRLAQLAPPANFEPDQTSALARFRRGREVRLAGSGGRWIWAAAACAGAVGVSTMAFPGTRVFAQKCVNACLAETGYVRASLMSRLHSEDVVPPSRVAAPDFDLQDADGKTVRLSDFKGRVVLLNFWATWCQPCNVEIPWFDQFQREYGGAGLTVLGVSMDDDGWTAVKPFLAAKKIGYRMVLGNDDVSRDFGGVESLPSTLLIDRTGRIAVTHVGLVEKSAYQADLRKLLAER